MKRKNFLRSITVGSIGAAAIGAGCTSKQESRTRSARPLMKVGCQSRRGTSTENLEYYARHGVFHMNPREPIVLDNGGWDYDSILQQQEEAAVYGISVEAYHLPLSSAGIDRVKYPAIMLGESPQRDRDIEIIQQKIEVAGRAGIPRLMYNTIILPILRTGYTEDPSRGNARYLTWDYEEAVRRNMDQEMRELTGAGDVDVDEIYERITYLLDRILPVAEEYNVKLANHIADPPAPEGFGGITRWNSPDVFEGIKRFGQLYDSPCHGFHLCIGSTAEGLRDPATEIFPIIEWIGSRNQIFNVHLRNIKGGWGYFEEVYPDNGDMNFAKVMRALRDVGYDGMVMPDHVPYHDDPGSRDQAFAFGYGYIKALIQMMELEAEESA